MLRALAPLSILAGLLVGCLGEPAPLADMAHLRSTQTLGSNLTGVTVDPAGDVYVVDFSGTISRVDGATLTPVFTGVLGLTDLAALGEGRFAVTRVNEGLLVDLEEGSMSQYFCYLPGDDIRQEPPPPTTQQTHELSHTVAYDAPRGLLYATPQTIVDATGEVVFSEVASFAMGSGDELDFRPFRNADLRVTGLAVTGDGDLLYGAGSVIYRGTFTNADGDPMVDLSPYGIETIEGMAYDEAGQTLWVVDGGRLYEIDAAVF